MEKNQIKIDLLGKSFVIRCDENLSHLQEVIRVFQLRLEHISKNLALKDPLKIALLTGIDLVDELVKLRVALNEKSRSDSGETSEISSIAEQLIERIDRCLSGN